MESQMGGRYLPRTLPFIISGYSVVRQPSCHAAASAFYTDQRVVDKCLLIGISIQMPISLPNLAPLRRYIVDHCDIKRHRMGCIAFTRQGYIISMACNRRGNGYVSEFSFHCEEMALRKASHFQRKNPREKVYLLVVRIRSNSDYGLAKPCEGCYQLCKEAGVSGIFYTTVDGIRSL